MAKDFVPPYVDKILVERPRIEAEIKKAAEWINTQYAKAKQPPVLLIILKGAIPFLGRLAMDIKIDVVFDFMVLSSFRGGIKASGKPQIVTDLMTDIKGRDVIIIEDVVDTARTLTVLINYLKLSEPKSIKTMVLVDKPACRMKAFVPDYSCFVIDGDPFLIGYGLDVKEIARNLPYIATFKKEYLDKI